MELVVMRDSKSRVVRREGSTPSLGTMLIIKFLIGFIIGYFIAHFVSGKNEGDQGKFKSIILFVGKNKIHIHHWIIAFVIIVFCMILPFQVNSLIYGLLLGIMLQGLKYSDRFKIIYKENEK